MKRYIKPETEITVVAPCAMVCESLHDELGDQKQLTKERETINFADGDSWK